MLSIIGGVILLLILARFGILSFLARIAYRIIRRIFIRVVYYYEKWFGGDEAAAA